MKDCATCKPMNWQNRSIIGIILFSFIIGIFLYPNMPSRMASHWDAAGNVNDDMPKEWGLFLMPVLSVVLYLLLLWFPSVDPLKANIAKFRRYFDDFMIGIFGFLLYVYVLTLSWNSGFRFEMIRWITPGLALIFYLGGVLMEKSKRNWCIGVRTPWTISSDKVWEKTNRLGGRLFKICALIALLGAVFPAYAIILAVGPVVISAIYSFVYSYIEYRKM